MRLLHNGHFDDHDRVPARERCAVGGRGARGAVRQSLPLHRLSEYRRCGARGRQDDADERAMTTRYFGAPVRRNEDKKLLTGRALFIDDVELPGMLHAAFLRSQVAHARIKHIDVSAARQRKGVIAVYTADDLGAYWQAGPLLVQPPPIPGIIFNTRTHVPLAKDTIRCVGEPI